MKLRIERWISRFPLRRKIQAVIIGVGGFLGLGEKDVAVPLDRITLTRDENNKVKYTIAAPKLSCARLRRST